MSRDLFEKRENLKPYEYPELLEYKNSIRHSYWIHTEYNYTTDIQNFHVDINDIERDIIKKAMLAISTIELKVKRFWGDLYKRMPKSEIDAVGATFAESEIRHLDAYAHLLELLGLNDEFKDINKVPAIKGREDYLDKYLSGTRVPDDRIFMKTILLFSLFVEHISLFSQFLIMMSFNKERNLFKGISNVIEATSAEENIHGLFGEHLIRILREERPEWFDEEMNHIVNGAAIKAYKAEVKILDWIYELGDLEFMPKETVKHYIKNRFNNSLKNIGYDPIFFVDEKRVADTEWFDLQISSTKEDDFFYKTSTAYNKKSIPVTEEDLF